MDERISSVERFLRGELTLADLEPILRSAATSQAAGDSAAVARYLDELYQSGRLPLQVHASLMAAVAVSADGTVRRHAAEQQAADSTRIGSPPEERTRMAASGPHTPVQAAWEPTRVRLPDGQSHVEPAIDSTRVRRPETAEESLRWQTSVVERTAGPGAATMPTSTGSNWAHPEQWTQRHEGPLGPGSVIKERFVLESVLGQGGMGVVYKALDRRKQEARDRDPYVALKILNEEFRQHPDSLIALQREAVRAQTLSHPNIINVFDFDRDGTVVFMPMELLEGQPLNRLISANKTAGVAKERAVALIRAMTEALAYAHKKGIVHSDLKPSNVFLTRTDEIKVLDFGIARAVTTDLRPAADDTVFDAAKLGALTPAYASAEMLRGEPPLPADDVFALGVIAYELLSGRHPFDREPADAARMRGLTAAPLTGVTRRQRKAIAKALSLERSDRQPDARSFLREFEGPTPIRKSVYAAIGVLAIALLYALYLNLQVRPDVPFESLSTQDQERFLDAVAHGDAALRIGDTTLDDALEAYSTAYEIHRNNPAAIAGLEEVAKRTLAAMAVNDHNQQERAVRRLFCQEYLSTYRPVVRACEAVHGAPCSAQAMRCD